MNRTKRMNYRHALLVLISTLLISGATLAQDGEQDELKLAALEALIAAPGDRALPIVLKVLDSDESLEFKERALFILSQINHPDARTRLLDLAFASDGPLRVEAIRMLGISGDYDSLDRLRQQYGAADDDLKDSIVEAHLIAGHTEGVLAIAQTAQNPDDFERAVNALGAMGAREELRALRERSDMFESIINALAISGDVDTLLEMARDDSNVEQQLKAIEALGIAGGGGEVLIDIYKNTDSDAVRESVRHGLLVSGHDNGVLDLYRAADDVAEKKELLQLLVMMGSDQAMEIIDAALTGEQ
ncbi:MAG: HEAT repeat domain-containing protein [Pseudomonadota bacterium]